MADDPLTVSEDAQISVERQRRPVGHGALAHGRWPDREDLRRARAARAWLNRGRPSSDPAVARQVLVEYREAQRRWARFGSWWSKALLAGFALLWAGSLVARSKDGLAAGAVVAEVGLLGSFFLGWVLVPRIEARRAPEMAQAAAEAQALLDRSGHS